ncbi:hypothetical protein RRG08_066634 [Elysia crispata]|uniref:Uncharacterized protein n=1 Tax=Elysia crispata TaxID=231223 RepID=A0AAE0ZJG6_9GAST|nr:hypothetical protein RRG08_066634 [Elysia crispata]
MQTCWTKAKTIELYKKCALVEQIGFEYSATVIAAIFAVGKGEVTPILVLQTGAGNNMAEAVTAGNRFRKNSSSLPRLQARQHHCKKTMGNLLFPVRHRRPDDFYSHQRFHLLVICLGDTTKFWSDVMPFGDNYHHNGIRSMQIMVIAFLGLSLSTRESIRKCLDYMWHIELNTDLS